MPKNVGTIKTWSAKITSRQFKFCKQSTAILIVLGKSYLYRTSTRHRKNSKQSGIVAIDSCFAIIVTLQYTWESRHITCLLEGESPSVKLISRGENKGLIKTNLKNMDITMQKLQHIGSIRSGRYCSWASGGWNTLCIILQKYYLLTIAPITVTHTTDRQGLRARRRVHTTTHFYSLFYNKKNMIRNRSGVLKVSSCLALKEKNKNKHKINVLGIDVYISLLVRGQSRKTSCKPWLHVGKFRESWSRVRQKLLSHAFTPQWTQGACNFSYCVWDEKREMS